MDIIMDCNGSLLVLSVLLECGSFMVPNVVSLAQKSQLFPLLDKLLDLEDLLFTQLLRKLLDHCWIIIMIRNKAKIKRGREAEAGEKGR